MNWLLKNLSMIFLLLFTFVSSGVAQETASGEVVATLIAQNEESLEPLVELNDSDSYVCFDYIVDVRPVDGQIHNIVDFIEGYQIDISESDIIRLELLFSLRNLTGGVFRVIGIGESKPVQVDSEALFNDLNIPFGTRQGAFIEIIEDVVRAAVRDGYERLYAIGNDLGLEQQQLRATISQVEEGESRISVPLGLSNHVQEGDVFYVYPKGSGNRNYNVCNDIRSYGPPLTLASATVIEIDDNRSILEMNVVEGMSVLAGDIVELSPEIDFASRLQGNTEFRGVLQFNVPNIYTFENINNNRKIWTRITRYIERFLVTEAGDFGFQAVTSR